MRLFGSLCLSKVAAAVAAAAAAIAVAAAAAATGTAQERDPGQEKQGLIVIGCPLVA